MSPVRRAEDDPERGLREIAARRLLGKLGGDEFEVNAAFCTGATPARSPQWRKAAFTDGYEMPLDRTGKHRHDGRDGNPGLYF